MTAIPFRLLLSAMLLPLMTLAGVAYERPIQCFPDPISSWGTSCHVMNYDIQMVVDELKMKDATLHEAMVSIRTAAAKNASNSHFNFVVLGQVTDPAKRITLDLKQVPLKLVLEEVARTFGLRLRTESSAVVLASPSSPEPIYIRTYRVPPYFLSTGSAAK